MEQLLHIPPDTAVEGVAVGETLDGSVIVGLVDLSLSRRIDEAARDAVAVTGRSALTVLLGHHSRREHRITGAAPVGKHLMGIAEGRDVVLVVDLHRQEVLISRRSVGGHTPSGAELTEVGPGGQALAEGIGEDP